MRCTYALAALLPLLLACAMDKQETSPITLYNAVRTQMTYEYVVPASGCTAPELKTCSQTKITFYDQEEELSERYEQRGCAWAYPAYMPGVTQSLPLGSHMIDCTGRCEPVVKRFDREGESCDGEEYTDYGCDLPAGLSASSCEWTYPLP